MISKHLIIGVLICSLLFGAQFSQIVFSNYNYDNYFDKRTQIIMPLRDLNFEEESHNKMYGRESSLYHDSSTILSENDEETPNLLVGTQTGVGGKNITIRDSFNLTGSSILDTQNSLSAGGLPTKNSDSITISEPTDFSRQTGYFNISNITAKNDWRLIENRNNTVIGDRTYTSDPSGDAYYEVAMSFNVTEEYANLTSVRIFITYDGSNPNGTLYIVNSTDGTQAGGPDDSQILSDQIELVETGSTWRTYTFSKPILLRGGVNYFVVMNDTEQSTTDYWRWWYQQDLNDDGYEDGLAFRKEGTHGSWNSWSIATLPLQIRVLPVEYNSTHYVTKKYTSPQNLSFNYNTKSINKFNWFKSNDTDNHVFQTNTSVTFDFQFSINHSFVNNPFNASIHYEVNTTKKARWNVTFITVPITTPYTVKNRFINLTNLFQDWNATSIYQNKSLIYGIPDPAVLYTNQTEQMLINASILVDPKKWEIVFDAPNYFLDFTIERGGIPFSLPYKANITDVLSLSFNVGLLGNTSYWIDYPNDTKLREETDVNNTHTTFKKIWDINSSVDQTTNVNGTYKLQAFWQNTDKTKVGTYIRTIDIFINTSLSVVADTEVIIGHLFNVTAYYKSLHNNSDVNNAKIWCNASWPIDAKQNVTMNQVGDKSYNASFSTLGQSAGSTGTIKITTQVSWFINWTDEISVFFVENSTLKVNITKTEILEWRENITFNINYTDSSGTGVSSGVTITIDGKPMVSLWDGFNEVYLVSWNSTNMLGNGTYEGIPITVSHSNYLNRIWLFNVSILVASTNLTAGFEGNILDNETVIPRVVKYTNSSADSFNVTFNYTYQLTGELLSTGTPSISTAIPFNALKVDRTWLITFNPNKTGTIPILIEFTLANYEKKIMTLDVVISKASVEIYQDPLTSLVINYTDTILFSLRVNNSDHNEAITGIPLNANDSRVQFENYVADYYWFSFNATNALPDSYSIEFTFTHLYYESASHLLSITVVEMPTLPLNTSSTLIILESDTILIEEDLSLTLEAYKTVTDIDINRIDTATLWLNDTLVESSYLVVDLSDSPFQIIIKTIGWQYGFYNLTLQVHTVGYQAQVFGTNVTFLGRLTDITINIEPGKRIQQGEIINITTTLFYVTESSRGYGAGVTQQIPLEGIDISYYVLIKYENGTSQTFEAVVPTDDLGISSYVIEGQFTKGATEFTNITIRSDSGLSGLPALYSMSLEDLNEYIIYPPQIDIFEVTTVVLIIVTIVIVSAVTLGGTVRIVRRRRKRKRESILQYDKSVERSFEDIKSIRLIIARHESGLQFYSEKTISEFQTDTDALSGMSAALSSFMEEVSDSMRSRLKDQEVKEKIETMSREGLHMLIWHGRYSSLIIISEVQLPEYFKKRLESLGTELEEKFEPDLQDFYSTDQIPSNIVKKIVRKFIPLHYFSAFFLNEGVLTLDSIKMSKRDKKMYSLLRKVHFEKKGMQFLFSEQIITQLSQHYKRSEAIEFLNNVIDWNLLVECDQDDLMRLSDDDSEL